MSYFELKQLAHLLLQLNFPFAVSIDSFHSPNFKLTCQILEFLLHLSLPDVELQFQISSEDDRVYFITTAVQLAQERLHLKLSAKRLYAADSNAAHELLKLANELCKYLYYKPSYDIELNSLFADLTGIAADLRGVSSSLVEKSTNLLVELRNSGDYAGELINEALSKQPDVLELENAVESRIAALSEESRRMDEDLTTARREKLELEEHLTEKAGDNSRMLERLDSIRTAKPPFIAELEQVEQDLTRVHEEYVKKHRSLSFLESELKSKDQRDAKKRTQEDMNRKTVEDIISKQEKEDIMGGAGGVDPFMVTPGPRQTLKDQVKISNAPIPEDAEEEYEYEEEEVEEHEDSTPIDSNEDLSDVLDEAPDTARGRGSAAESDGGGAGSAAGSAAGENLAGDAEESPDILTSEPRQEPEEQEFELEEEEVVYEYEEGIET